MTFLKVSLPPPRLFPSALPPSPFSQRKNGLFKKAYELGVLCSVDVAVLVFDNKQGGPRLYQYGSDDVITIVERAIRVRATPPPSPLAPSLDRSSSSSRVIGTRNGRAISTLVRSKTTKRTRTMMRTTPQPGRPRSAPNLAR